MHSSVASIPLRCVAPSPSGPRDLDLFVHRQKTESNKGRYRAIREAGRLPVADPMPTKAYSTVLPQDHVRFDVLTMGMSHRDRDGPKCVPRTRRYLYPLDERWIRATDGLCVALDLQLSAKEVRPDQRALDFSDRILRTTRLASIPVLGDYPPRLLLEQRTLVRSYVRPAHVPRPSIRRLHPLAGNTIVILPQAPRPIWRVPQRRQEYAACRGAGCRPRNAAALWL